MDGEKVLRHIECYEDQEYLRGYLAANNLIAFVGNGSMLARLAGDSDLPLLKGAVPFVSDAANAVTVKLPHRGDVVGMAFRPGITLIVGGGSLFLVHLFTLIIVQDITANPRC